MDSIKILNTDVSLEFNGTEYRVKRANLEKVILFQKRAVEVLEKHDPAYENILLGYCLYLVLKDVKPDITEEWVLQNTPGDTSMVDVVEKFGFLSRQKVEGLRRAQQNAPAQTGEPSSS